MNPLWTNDHEQTEDEKTVKLELYHNSALKIFVSGLCKPLGMMIALYGIQIFKPKVDVCNWKR